MKFKRFSRIELEVWILLFIGVVLLFLNYKTIKAFQDEAKQRAQSNYNLYQESLKRGGLQSNYFNPILSNVPLYTIDRTKSGHAQLLCPSSGEFLTIVGQPTSTGDLNLFIYYDSDRNGSLDKQLVINGISGICANGFFICNPPGRMNECWTYMFGFNPANRSLYYYLVDQTRLGGCFCINNFCGNNLFWRNVEVILSTIGGAIVQAFLNADSSYAISSSVLEGTSIKFYGQSVSECIRAGGSSQVSTLGNYLYSPGRISSDVQNLYTSSIRDPKSAAYQVHQASMNDLLRDPSEIRECKINYNVVKRHFHELFTYEGGCAFAYEPGTYCGSNCIEVVVPVHERPRQWTTTRVYFLLPMEYYRALDRIDYYSCGRCHTTEFYLNGALAYRYTMGPGEYFYTISIPVTNLIPPTKKQASLQTMEIRVYTNSDYLGCHVECETYRTIRCGAQPKFPLFKFWFNRPVDMCVVIDEYYDNKCLAYENDPDCVLWEEVKDGVYTVREGMKTGLNPMVTCQEHCNRVICEVWEIKRKYKCTKRQNVDFQHIERRLSVVTSSINVNTSGGSLTYDDWRWNNGTGRHYSGNTLRFSPFITGDECEPVCKVEVSPVGREIETDLSLRGEKVSRRHFVYKPCERSGTRYVCPTKAGETIINDCTCHSFFTEATIALQAMRLASNDLICSSGSLRSF